MAARRKTRGPEAPERRKPGRPPLLHAERILSAAARLFRARGFRGTSIDDIGAALGTSGPALYRHFPSKEALLEAVLRQAVERARRDVDAVRARGLAPAEALEEIVRHSVAHTIEESDLVIIAAQEVRSLPAAARERIQREQRDLVRRWIDALRAVRPALSSAEARATVAGAIALIQTVARVDGLSSEDAEERFTRMALAALHAK